MMRKLILPLIALSISLNTFSAYSSSSVHKPDLINDQEVKLFKYFNKLEQAKLSKNEHLIIFYEKKLKKHLRVLELQELSPGIIEKLF